MPETLSTLLTLPTPPEGALGWHAQICAGLPATALKNLAREAAVSERVLGQLALGTPGLPRKGQLSRGASDFTYRLGLAWLALTQQKGLSQGDASRWLTSPNPMLKERVPLAMLQTQHGASYVMTAASRLA